MNVIEDEYHFIQICQLYRDIRREYFPSYYCHWPTASKFKSLLSSNQSSLLNKVAKYVYLPTMRRESILDDWALLKHHKQVNFFAWPIYCTCIVSHWCIVNLVEICRSYMYIPFVFTVYWMEITHNFGIHFLPIWYYIIHVMLCYIDLI